MNNTLYKITLLLALLFLGACSDKSTSLKGQVFSVELSQQAKSFPVNELFEFDFKISPATKVEIKVDCTMPSHGHGMNTQTVVEELGQGQYKVKGMQLHMEGEWLLSFEIFENDQLKERLEHPFTL